MGDTLFVLAGSTNPTVYRFTLGDVLPAEAGHFDVSHPDDRSLAAALNPSMLACLSDQEQLAIAAPQVGAITTYRTDGSDARRYQLRGFVPVQVERGDRGSVRFRWPSPERWYHVVTSVFGVSDSDVGVHIGVVREGARGHYDVSDPEIRILRLGVGEIVSMPTVGVTFAAVDGLAYGALREPYPMIRVGSLRGDH